MTWLKNLKGTVKPGVSLRQYTSFKIGGPAQYFVEPDNLWQLQEVLCAAQKKRLKVRVLGAGSNLLIADAGVRGIVVRLNGPAFTGISLKGRLLTVGSGASLARSIAVSKQRNVSCLEFLVGVPGTVGGAVAMNAGAWGKCIADVVENVTVMDYNGRVRVLSNRQCNFGYRSSGLEKHIIIGAVFTGVAKDRCLIEKAIASYRAKKRGGQDFSYPNAGCIFKNPEADTAGRLIDVCGFKGVQIGGAAVSSRHANFILNKGKASASDVCKLMRHIRRRVSAQFGVTLKPEIRIWK